MGYALLWLENLVFWLCLGALGVAWSCRIEGRRYRVLVLVMTFGVPLLALGTTAGLAGVLRFVHHVYPSLFAPLLALAVGGLMGLIVVFVRGRTVNDLGRCRAADWRPGSLGLAVLGTAAVHAMTFWNLDLAVRQQMESVRTEAGALATSLAPLRVLERDNAAALYQQAFDNGLMGPKPAAYEKWLTQLAGDGQGAAVNRQDSHAPAASGFDPRDPEFVDYIQRDAELCRLLREAAARPACNFSRDWGRPSFAMLLGETQNMRGAARELQLEAHYLATTDIRLAFADVLAMHAMADHVGQEPFLVSLLVSYAIDSMAVKNLESLLQQYPVTDEDLSVFDNWRPSPTMTRLQRAVRMEEALGLATLSQFAEWRNIDKLAEPLGLPAWPPNATPLYRVFLLGQDLTSYRDAYATVHRILQLNVTDRKGQLDLVDEELKRRRDGILVRLLIPAIRQSIQATDRLDAQQRLAMLAIAAHRFRLAQGQFPETMEQLVTHSRTIYARDPFDGKPMKLRRRDGDVILYSVGPNLFDDGGTPFAPQNPTDYDLTFVLHAPAPTSKSSP